MTNFGISIIALSMILSTFFQVLASPLFEKEKSSTVLTTSRTNAMQKTTTEKKMEIGAWIYPGAPTCNALRELADGRKIDIIKSEYFQIDEQGKLVLLTEKENGCNAFSNENVRLTKKYSREQYVTISSADSDKMDLFLSSYLSDLAIQTYLNDFVIESDLTGVEIDFEDFGRWSPEVYTKYTQFITKLGTELHLHKKKLLIDGPAISNEIEQAWYVWKYEDFEKLPVDRLIVMTYDYQYDQGVGQPISPTVWILNTIAWTLKKITDPTRLSMGIPAYGYEGTDGTQNMKLLTFEEIKKKPGFNTAQRDPESQEMTWRQADTVYFYQDSVSMQHKLEAIRATGISAVSIWHLGGNQWFTK